jgi:hypothetical protein
VNLPSSSGVVRTALRVARPAKPMRANSANPMRMSGPKMIERRKRLERIQANYCQATTASPINANLAGNVTGVSRMNEALFARYSSPTRIVLVSPKSAGLLKNRCPYCA